MLNDYIEKADLVLDSVIFLMNYLVKNLMLPGQIEKYIAILDFDNKGI